MLCEADEMRRQLETECARLVSLHADAGKEISSLREANRRLEQANQGLVMESDVLKNEVHRLEKVLAVLN